MIVASISNRYKDSREPYIRNKDGQIVALRIHGFVGNLPNHEQYIHNGIAHQNPAVEDGIGGFMWMSATQTRYYPFTNNGVPVDFAELERDLAVARKKGADVWLVGLNSAQEREVVARENGQQLVLSEE